MNRDNEGIWKTLHEAGLVQPPAPVVDEPDSPWFIKVLLAISGWFASLFLLGFVGLGFVFVVESGVASLVTGGAMVGGAYALLRFPKNEFVEHLGLAVSLAGQGLIVWSFFRLNENFIEMPWLLIIAVELPLAILMPNFVHRVFSSFWAAFALSLYLAAIGLPYLSCGLVLAGTAWLWLNEFRFPGKARLLQSLGYGLVLTLIPIGGSVLFRYRSRGLFVDESWAGLWFQPWMGEVLAGAVALYVVWQLLKQTERRGRMVSRRATVVTQIGILILCAASLEAPGVIVAVVIMLLGFASGNRVLLGLGIVSLLFYISSYYYLLDITLLAKAQTLLTVGVVLLLARWLMPRLLPAGRENGHA